MTHYAHFSLRFCCVALLLVTSACSKETSGPDDELEIRAPQAAERELSVIGFNVENRDAAELETWIADQKADICCLSGLDGTHPAVDGYEAFSIGALSLLSRLPIVQSDQLSLDGITLIRCQIGTTRIVICDLGETVSDIETANRFETLLNVTYNNPEYMEIRPRWIIFGSFPFCSSMDFNWQNRPAWYPDKLDDTAYAADLSAWNNGLKDPLATLHHFYIPTAFDPVSGHDFRHDYIYVSDAIWQYVIQAEVVDTPFTELLPDCTSHRPIRYRIRYYDYD